MDLMDCSEDVMDYASPAQVLATGQSATNLCPASETTVEFQGAGGVGPSLQQQAEVVKLLLPAESLAAGQDAADRCTPLQLELISGDETVVSTHSNPAEKLATEQSATSLCSQLAGEGVPVVVDGTSVSTCIPQGWGAVGPDLQQHDELSPVTLSSLQRLKGLQGEGPVQASSQR